MWEIEQEGEPGEGMRMRSRSEENRGGVGLDKVWSSLKILRYNFTFEWFASLAGFQYRMRIFSSDIR